MTDAHEQGRCEGSPLCPECNQEAASAAFEAVTGKPAELCPTCGQPIPDEPVRMTEAVEHTSEGIWNSLLHPRADKGSPNGGQFTVGGGSGGSTSAPSAKGGKGHKGKVAKGRHKAVKQPHMKHPRAPGSSRTSLSPTQIRTLQLALKVKVDGRLGTQTTAAIKAAQKRLGMPQTGRATGLLLRKLTAKPQVKTPRAPAGKRATTQKAAKTVTHISVKEADASQPYGDVEYADPGYQADKKKRYPLDTEKHVRSAWSYINQADNAGMYSAADLKKVKAKIVSAAKKLGIEISQATEATINGAMSFSDVLGAINDALRARARAQAANSGNPYAYVSCYVVDATADDVVYAMGDDDDLYQCSYELGDDGEVTLGEPTLVVRTYQPAPQAMQDEEDAETPGEEMAEEGDGTGMAEATRDRIEGRVIEAAGTDADGGRIFTVRIIANGDSKNGRRYPAATLQEAAPLYEGARAYDHHRTEAELRSSTINGLIGSYRNVEAKSDGLYGDLHLLPGATHAAELLDATLAAQEAGLPPLIGVSHDVMARYRPVVDGGKRLQEATAIVKVNSADLVADPAAGGKATRMVAGGIDTGTLPENQEDDVPPTKEDVLAALSEATDDELAGVGLSRAIEEEEDRTTEAALAKASTLGRMLIRHAVEEAGLPVAVVESLTETLPDRITEADVAGQIASLKAVLGVAERAGLAPTVGRVEVTQEAMQKKRDALDAFFAGDFDKGYRSFKEAFVDITGRRPKSFDEDFNRTVMRESVGAAEFDSTERSTESADSTTWNLILGDSITRRLVAEYQQPSLQTWKQVVSSVVPVSDFRTQRIDRLGGYGTLPAVNQSAPYQPLTTPTNEEVTYAITKRGGTEDITLEMIANDDVRAIVKIPVKLGLAAAQTLYRFVWDLLRLNGNIYDGSALFVAGHNNDASSAALNQSNLSLARAAMRQQTAYGDTADILSLVPKTLVVPSSLEEEAWQLVTSAVANPAPSGTQGSVGAANTPNIHQGMDLVVVDYLPGATGTPASNKWYVVADPSMCPTIEMGFYQGRQTPELFTQQDPTIGSMFNADRVTYKIRHIYSGAVLDFRGFYRNGIP